MSEENKNNSNYTFWAEQITSQSTETSSFDTNQSQNSTYAYDSIPPFPPQELTAPKRKKSKTKKVFGFIGKAAVFGIIAGLTFYASNQLIQQFSEENSNPSQTTIQVGSGNANLLLDKPDSDHTIPSTPTSAHVDIQSTDVSQVVEDTMPATVAITSTYNTTYDVWGYQYGSESTGGGSGIIIGQKDDTLYIATNNHVVEGASKIMISFIDGSEAEALIRGRNSSADLAVITVDASTLTKETLAAIKVAKLGDSDDVKVGQMAIAIGNALGYGQSVTVGYISAKDREITVDANTTLTVLQTDAAINPGNSGGALININGEVIGINSAKFSKTDVEGIGYSIPITIAYPIVDELMNREILTDEEKGYLGVYPQDVDESVAQMYDWPIGVYVYSLVEGGAADKAGIYAGDIITAINNITISSGDQLRETVNSYRYGTTVTVTFMRFTNGEYKEHTVDVVLQKGTNNGSSATTTPDSENNLDQNQAPEQAPNQKPNQAPNN